MGADILEQRVLVVDDDDAIRTCLSNDLMVCGYDVVCACDGAEALFVLEQGNPPRLVIADLIMPRLHGLDTIIRIRLMYPAVRVLALSGCESQLARAWVAGADAVLAKPFEMDDLERMVAGLMRVRG